MKISYIIYHSSIENLTEKNFSEHSVELLGVTVVDWKETDEMVLNQMYL